jgi:hypothetical protein
VRLTNHEQYVLKWLTMKPQPPSDLDIFAHAGAMASLRWRGLVKRVRRPGWTQNVLTKVGEQALTEMES